MSAGPVRGTRPLGGTTRILSLRHVRWTEVDWHLLVVALVLLLFGLEFIRAMDASPSSRLREAGHYAGHLKKVAITLPLTALGMCIRPSWLRRHAVWIYAGTLLLLLLVPLVGDERNNARRWIQLPHFDLQPSELAKLGVIVMLASLLARNRLAQVGDWVRPLLAALVPMALVALQPDLGTALTIVPVTLGMLYLAGARARTLALLCGLGLLVAAAAFEFGLIRAYQLGRVETWAASFEPEGLIEQKNRLGFHVYHARTAIGNGGLFGRGMGEGIANETGYLPERDCDSIFAVMAEESGFVGASALLFLYTLLVVLLMISASGLRDRFSRLVVGGVALYFAAHMVINVSVNLGLLPMTGLPLPLFSTGGSSLLATFLGLGLALGLASHHVTSLDQDAFRTF